MTETVNKDEFVELDYTGMLKELDVVFDTTIEAIARKEGIHDPKMTYGTVALCIGQGQILPGLDESLVGLEVGKESEVTLPPEKAFGKKDGKLMKLVPTSAFKKQGVNPVVGLQVNIDGSIGTIRNVTGGRTIVDFNHPFAGKEVTYIVTIRKKITDDKEKVIALVELALNQKRSSITVEINDGKAVVDVKQDFPVELLDMLKERITKVLPQIKEVEFKTPKKDEPKKEAPEDAKPAEKPAAAAPDEKAP